MATIQYPLFRCGNVKRKKHLTNSERAKKHSGWQCFLLESHLGICQLHPSYHQSPWGIWRRLDGSLFEQRKP